MNVLVTGWAGYIGPVVIRHLRAARYHVIGLDTGWFLPNYADLPEYPDEAIYADIREGVFVGWPDVVIHLAGLSNDPLGDMDPAMTTDINIGGTWGVLSAHPDARHIIVSSCSVYGTADMATEETEPAPLTQYAKAKACIDRMTQKYGLEAVSLRLGTVYGWSPGHRLDLVVNQMAYSAAHGRGVTVSGNAARPLVHVEDVARAIVFMVEREERGIYNVVGENRRMGELGEQIAGLTKASLVVEPGGADQRDYSASGDKLAALGWQPQHTVESTIPDLLVKSRRLGLQSRYKRLPAIQRLVRDGVLTPDLYRKESVAA